MALRWPRPLMRIIDPANVYFDDRSPHRHKGPIYRGGAVFGPGVPGGSRQTTDDEIAQSRRQTREKADPRPVTAADRLAIARAAQDLIDTGTAAITDGSCMLRARVVRFWRGDAVLEVEHAGGGRTLTRIPRTLGPEHADMLIGYLSRHLGGS